MSLKNNKNQPGLAINPQKSDLFFEEKKTVLTILIFLFQNKGLGSSTIPLGILEEEDR